MKYKYRTLVICIAFFDGALSSINLIVGIFYNFLILLVLFHGEAREWLLGELEGDLFTYSYPESSWVFWSAREISEGSTIMMGIIWGCTLLAIIQLLAAIHLARISKQMKSPKEIIRVAKCWKAANGVTLLVNSTYYLVTGFWVHPIFWLYLVIELLLRCGFQKIVNEFVYELEYYLMFNCPLGLPVSVLH